MAKIIFATNFGYELFVSEEAMFESEKYTDHNSVWFEIDAIEHLYNDDISAFLSSFPTNCQSARRLVEGYVKGNKIIKPRYL